MGVYNILHLLIRQMVREIYFKIIIFIKIVLANNFLPYNL